MKENIWVQSVKDFLTKKMLTFALIPFLGTLVLMYTLFFSVAGAGLEALEHSAVQVEQHRYSEQNGVVDETHTVETAEGAPAVLRFLMEHTITSWLVSFVFYTIGGLFTFILAMFVALFIIGFLTPYIVAEIQRRHYPLMPQHTHGSIPGILLATVKHFLIMLILLLVLTPLYFIPVVNLIAFNLPFYYFFHKMYLLDVASETLTKARFKEVMFYKGGSIRMTTAVLYGISLVPFAAYVTPVFNVILLTHALMRHRLEVETNHPHAESERDEPKQLQP